MSLDHDLGEGRATGYLVARFIERRASEGKLARLFWAVHSANSVGAANMRAALQSADRFWASAEANEVPK